VLLRMESGSRGPVRLIAISVHDALVAPPDSLVFEDRLWDSPHEHKGGPHGVDGPGITTRKVIC
jgi:hypothetical protein